MFSFVFSLDYVVGDLGLCFRVFGKVGTSGWIICPLRIQMLEVIES